MYRYTARLLLVSVVLTTCFFASTTLHAEETVIKLRYSDYLPPTVYVSVLFDQWCKEVEKRTNGRVKITHFAGGTLSPIAQTYDTLVKGGFELGTSAFSYSTGRFPLSDVLDLPLAYTTGYQAVKLANEYYKKFKPKELDDVQVMYLYAHGPTYIHTKKPISKLDEIKGLRIKSTGSSARIVTALGGTPVTIPLPETYDALKRGLADGLIHQMGVLKTYRFGEILKYTLIDNGMSNTTACFVVMNKQKWASLPRDIQKVIEAINEEWIEKHALGALEEDRESEAFLIKSGGHILRVSKTEREKTAAKMKPVFDEYLQSTRAKGLPGDEALKFCLDYVKAHP
jgi:TRAP-type C4-dicarboxylate transport system substrate-binding protein